MGAAIYYRKDGFDTSGSRLLGRQAAGEGLLRAMARYSTGDKLWCYTHNKATFDDFCKRVEPMLQGPRKRVWISEETPQQLCAPGVLYRPDSVLSDLAWQRRFYDPRGYGLCGVTHTIASKGALQSIADLLLAPVEPWDALICTSQAVRTAVDGVLTRWGEYLTERTGGHAHTEVQLPVIPLGIDCGSFELGADRAGIRARMRTQLGVGEGELVVLFVGRLIFYAKAHPVPMYLALQKAAELVGKKVHLVQAGWFEDAREDKAFRAAGPRFCPSVEVHFVDGRQPQVRRQIWAAADLFMSLSDNVQETFGLAPIEAMASGLPVVVSDWDGYRESVRDRIDGFRVPTVVPPAGVGVPWAAQHTAETLNYSGFIANACMATAVDVEACTQALVQLLSDAELRRTMGEAGKARARSVYDWKVVIGQYEELWQEQRTRKARAEARPVQGPAHPLVDDPFRVFAHYATQIMGDETRLELGTWSGGDRIAALRSDWMANFGAGQRLTDGQIDTLLAEISKRGSVTVRELRELGIEAAGKLQRTLVYLLKMGVLRRSAG